MTVEWMSCEVPELLKSSPFAFADERGELRKVLSGPFPGQEPFRVDEVFWSRSHKGTLRGLHVQAPPRAGRKIVLVTSGEARDFVVDLRVGSPWFGRPWETSLGRDSGALLIPAGCAHGFEALTNDATMVYLQEETYDPLCDTGVLWSSAGIHASTPSPIVSPRDSSLPAIEDFESPFTWVDP